jgi:hypothetical protein
VTVGITLSHARIARTVIETSWQSSRRSVEGQAREPQPRQVCGAYGLLAGEPRANALGREFERDRTKAITQGERSEYKSMKEKCLALGPIIFGNRDFSENTMDLGKIIRFLFGFPSKHFLRKVSISAIRAKSSFGRTTWPRRALRVGLTTLFQNLDHQAGCASAQPI